MAWNEKNASPPATTAIATIMTARQHTKTLLRDMFAWTNLHGKPFDALADRFRGADHWPFWLELEPLYSEERFNIDADGNGANDKADSGSVMLIETWL